MRLSGFLAPIKDIEPQGWWQQLLGKAPDNSASRPARGEWTLSSEFGANTLALSVQPGRFDWFLTPDIAKASSDDAKFPVLGDLENTTGAFAELMSKWLTLSPVVIRLAYGAVLLGDVTDRVSGYEELARYLPDIRLDPEKSQDFFYQINRPRKSSVEKDLSINRLSKWSVALVAPVALTVTPQNITSAMGPASFGCRLELDISTPADLTTPLSGQNLPNLLKEFLALSEEIASIGDVP